jgi:hypothetical protein
MGLSKHFLKQVKLLVHGSQVNGVKFPVQCKPKSKNLMLPRDKLEIVFYYLQNESRSKFSTVHYFS